MEVFYEANHRPTLRMTGYSHSMVAGGLEEMS